MVEQKESRRVWVVLAGCCLMEFVGFGITMDAIGLFFEPVIAELGAGRGAVTTYLTFQVWSSSIVCLFAGRIIPKANYKRILVACSFVFGGCFFAMSKFSEAWHWYIAGVIMGIAMAFIAPLGVTIIISNWFEKRRGFATGLVFAFAGVAGAIMSPISNHIIHTSGWRTGYVFYAVVCVVILLPTALFLVDKSPEERGLKPYGAGEAAGEAAREVLRRAATANPSAKEETGGVFRNYGMPFSMAVKLPVLYALAVSSGLISFAGGLNQLLPGHAILLGHPANYSAAVLSIIMIDQFIAGIPLGILIDKIGVKKSVTIYCICGAAGMLLIYFFGKNTVALLIGAFLYGIGVCQTFVVPPLIVRAIFGRKDFPKINAIVATCTAIIGSSCVGLSGMLADRLGDYSGSLLMNPCLYLISIFAIFGIYRASKPYIERNILLAAGQALPPLEKEQDRSVIK